MCDMPLNESHSPTLGLPKERYFRAAEGRGDQKFLKIEAITKRHPEISYFHLRQEGRL